MAIFFIRSPNRDISLMKIQKANAKQEMRTDDGVEHLLFINSILFRDL